jgi:carbamoyl-phosphate synthase large subunit
VNNKVNILITSAGRRVSLIKAFVTELNSRIPGASVFTGEMNPEWSAGCRISDGYFVLPRITDSDYINKLLDLCLRENIGLVVPTIDTELKILSENSNLFSSFGIALAVSDLSLVNRCRDKRKTNELFLELGIDIPLPIDRNNPTFPLFLKPYDGSLSKDILLVQNSLEWNVALLNNEKLMFMEYLSPDEYQEFTVDAYFDKESTLKCLVPRRRIEVRGGEISKGRVEKGALYKVLKDKFRNIPGAKSCLTMQFFEHRVTGRIVGIEINPRFGGGFPLTYAAGGSYPGFLIDEYILGKDINFYEDWIDGRVMLRYDAEVIIDAESFS